MRKIKVRFNLSKGKNFGKWKIWSKSGCEYHSPEIVQLILYNCQLKNNRKTAQKIYDGENKEVCAWILCESITINHLDQFKNLQSNIQIKYNPRKNPYWDINNIDSDNLILEKIFTNEKKIYEYPRN